MALLALVGLLLASFTGLVTGRWRALLVAVPVIAACALLAGPVAAALALLAAVGMGAGVRLRQVLAEG